MKETAGNVYQRYIFVQARGGPSECISTPTPGGWIGISAGNKSTRQSSNVYEEENLTHFCPTLVTLMTSSRQR